MNQKALKTLEYNKIIAQLEEYASTQIGKTLCRELVPSCSLEEIRRNQTETTDAATRVRMKGSLSFGVTGTRNLSTRCIITLRSR